MHEEPQLNQKFVLPSNLIRIEVLPTSHFADFYVARWPTYRHDLRSRNWLRGIFWLPRPNYPRVEYCHYY